MIGFLDPGVTTGYALFDSKGVAKEFGQIVGVDKLVEFLKLTHRSTPLERIVSEGYRIDPNKVKNLNRHQEKGHRETMEAIGKIKAFCEIMDISYEEVHPGFKNAGYAQGGFKKLPQSQHKESHKWDALAIGVAWCVKKGLRTVKRRHFD